MDNKHVTYRKIRYDRTYRPLGRMTWWRVVLGILLLVFVFLMAGTFSQQAASGGHFLLAEKLMIVPSWMERYKPDTKAFIESGAFLAEKEFDAAFESAIEVEPSNLSPNSREAFRSVCETLEDHFHESGGEEDEEKASRIQALLERIATE